MSPAEPSGAPAGGAGGSLLEVGRVVAPHGVRGEVVVVLVTNRTERLAPGSSLIAGTSTLLVETSRPHRGAWLVRFVGLGTREQAEALRGATLLAEPIDDADVLWVHELVGSSVLRLDGAMLGRVVAVEANPASDLLVLESGALVPLCFVQRREPGLVWVDPPPGLVDPEDA